MRDWLQPEFDKYRQWIDSQRGRGKSWEEILRGKPNRPLDVWLLALEDADYPPLGTSPEEREAGWKALVDWKRKWEEEAARNGRVPVVVGPDAADRDVDTPRDPHSSWQQYKKHLSNNGYPSESIDSIQSSSLRILRRLKWETSQPEGAIKGMVVGHVQSGKTASMAGLISMAMDWGWNLIVVLTGTIENLRIQTYDRLLADLNHGGNLGLHPLHHPSDRSGERAQDLSFGSESRQRYLIVSLKNPGRLSNLLRWLQKDPSSLEKMRILIIDDEADQASIDTSPKDKEERSRINGLIVDLTKVKAKCVNYVAYTATPYANFLNEAWPESLYPKNFIIALPQSSDHFGPRQVFGIAGAESEGGLGIVCDIPKTDLLRAANDPVDRPTVSDIHNGAGDSLPKSLEDSICWFLCCAAAIRVYGDVRKPVSMLVHTSARQVHHENLARAIESWLKEKDVRHLELCQRVWNDRKSALTVATFRLRMPDYGQLNSLRDYPEFDSLIPHIRTLLGEVTHIQMEDGGGAFEPKFHEGTHLCIDNCANNGVSDEGEHIRLLYPGKKQLEGMAVAPAFLVVGGSTLSRGLTIENLVSTYFLRGGTQMDTLMQMGRWFGYRKGYELLPRIWMPEETRKKFVFMAGVEQELREELALFMDGGRDPAEYGPRVRVHPSATWLRPTAQNRMKEIQGAEYDFSGTNKQTTIFHARREDKALLDANLSIASKLVASLGKPSESPRKSAIWRSVGFHHVAEFLCALNVHGRDRFFTEISAFVRWFRKNENEFDAWNVVVAGLVSDAGAAPETIWRLPNAVSVRKVSRTRLVGASDAGSVSIGVLRDPTDLLADAGEVSGVAGNISNREISKKRAEAGLGKTPQLLIYCIDRNSRNEGGADGDRGDLGVPQDLVGVSIWVPGVVRSRGGFATHVSVRIPDELRSEEDDLEIQQDVTL